MANERLTYYKLISEYPGDITKNCGLTATEVDENFYFLRGSDIKGFLIDDETKEVSLERFNGERIAVPLDDISYDFNYDKETGILTITAPNGKFIELTGFYSNAQADENRRIFSDDSLSGDGTKDAPLSLGGAEKTGTLAACRRLVDITKGEQLPSSPAFGERYVTKETINPTGVLYDYSGVKEVAEVLDKSSSEWRIPSKEDWDKLLNSLECEDDRNHDSTGCNKWAGRIAGKFLKSSEFWKYSEDKTDDDGYDYKGIGLNNFDIYPVGAKWNVDRDNIDGIGTDAILWTSTPESDDDNADIYVKQFKADRNKAMTSSKGPDDYYSLRLVKDYKNNYKSIESICGISIPCSLMPDSEQVWTSINFPLRTTAENSYAETDEWHNLFPSSLYGSYYFIAEFNGKNWDKKVISEGNAVVLIEHNGLRLHEWRMDNGNLVDVAEIIQSNISENLNKELKKIQSEINEANAGISANTENIKTISGTVTTINSEIENIKETHAADKSALEKQISDNKTDADTKISGLTDTITTIQGELETIKETHAADKSALEKQISDNKTDADTKINNLTTSVNKSVTNLQEQIAANNVKLVNDDDSILNLEQKEDGKYLSANMDFGVINFE